MSPNPGPLGDEHAEYDIIIAGAGSAGCVLARRLAEDPDLSVLLIEAGGPEEHLAEVREARDWAAQLGGPLDWQEVYAPSESVKGRRIPIPRGRVVGGSSSINAMLWYRGHPDDYDAWEAAGATGWNYRTLLPYFKRSEDWVGGESATRGSGGPMRVEVSPDPHPVADSLLSAAEELGLPVIEDANGLSNEGACLANFNATTQDGSLQRWSAARGYLRPAAAWPNLTVRTDAEVTELTFESGQCTGVVIHQEGRSRSLRATLGVVLTLGALGTPRLLMRSGIGPADQLTAVGLAPRLNLPGVGANFQDHPLLMGMNFRLREPRGPLRDNGGGAMLNWRSSVADQRPDLHAFVVQGAHAGPQVASRYGVHHADEKVCAISPGLMRSQSVGELRLLSPGGDLDIQPNYLAEPDDMTALIEGIDTVLELAQTQGYRELIEGPISPDRRLSRREAEEFVRLSCDTFFHCCGSAKMGIDAMSVVSPELRVHGTENLWVADASVIPVIPTCNIQAPVIAVAERAAVLIREELAR
ncbi:GMC family oxidoreductase [Nesterenkonia halotolerans]|uniref:Choline dehydrogenase n=1 Tax=Nesterenkonia halotolerans TaxID=225325 RepID=A0ABR9J659_9MICC|nr:GMC family oxidoreductase N-terminal domain-containing protein [Nesterenkonia halotolerans]MBE1514478.1 choline dehydrogenase [Nesterenkonia halotolerans]